jgi:hypothetical protein
MVAGLPLDNFSEDEELPMDAAVAEVVVAVEAVEAVVPVVQDHPTLVSMLLNFFLLPLKLKNVIATDCRA